MANNRFYGYTPKPSNEKDGNRLDQLNPYEFRKGMDIELTKLGCMRLQESTPEEREKSTETAIKNLEKHPSYYSALIQFESGMNQGSPINEKTFNNFLKTYTGAEGRGDGMQEVNKDFKDDKMEELKEAIKKEMRYIIKEQDEEDFDADVDKADKAASKGAKKSTSKSGNRFDLEKEAIKDLLYRGKKGAESEHTEDDPAPKSILAIKDEMLQTYKDKFKGKEKGLEEYKELLKKANEKFQKDLEKHVDKFGEKGKGNTVTLNDVYGEDLPATIKLLGARIKDIEKEEEADVITKTSERRLVAQTDMTRAQHIKLLEICKEHGVNLREGAMGVKMYYEIAKAAYLEGVADAHKL